MKKLVLVVVDALSDLMIHKNLCSALNGFYKREIKSTVPFLPNTAEATLWTGLPVSQHGVTSLNGKKDTEAPKLWQLPDVNVSIDGKLGKDVEGLVDPKEADLEIIEFGGLVKACKANGIESKPVADKFAKLSDLLEKRGRENIMVISPCGYTRYIARFNLAVLLQGRNFCIFEKDSYKSNQSSAYPAAFGDDDALQFGVYMNRKPDGWLDSMRADNIQGSLTSQMGSVPNITVQPKVRIYQEGKYFDTLPDLIFYANRDIVFPTLGRQRQVIFEGFFREDFSINTLMFTNFQLFKFRTKPIFLHEISSLVSEYFSMRE